MTEPVWLLDQLKPMEALRLAASAASSCDDQTLGQIRFLFDEGAFGMLVTLVTPEAAASLNASYREDRGEPARGEMPEHAVPYAEGMVRTLLASAAEVGLGQEDQLPPEEFLVMGENLSRERAKMLFVRLELHATSVKMSAAQNIFYFRVRDDHSRDSLLNGLIEGGELADCTVLKGKTVAGRVIYLPRLLEPPEAALELFAATVEAHPKLFATTADSSAGAPWFLISQEQVSEGNARIRFITLTRLGFVDSFMVSGARATSIDFQLSGPQRDTRYLEALAKELDRDAPDLGYRLSLRSMKENHSRDRERDRLAEQIAELSYRLAYLDSMSRPRPVLMRFPQSKLPALAEVLRAFPMDVLLQDRLRYGFHATSNTPAGHHYILADPDEAVMNALDPLILWEDAGEPPITFQLDPFWAAHYHDNDSHSLVFVPKGVALDPPLHDWDRQGMDRYLRRMIARWFQGQPGANHLPPHPLYLFEEKSGGRVQLSVLDRDKFQPLRLKLGWLTDNLMLNEQIGVEELMHNLAADLRRKQLSEIIAERAAQAGKQFEEIAAETGEAAAETVTGLERALTSELNRAVEETFLTAGHVHELRETLRSWEKGEKEMREMLAKIKKNRVDLLTETEDRRTKFGEMEARVRKQLSTSRRRRMDIIKDIGEEIQNLREARARIRKDLFKLKFWE